MGIVSPGGFLRYFSFLGPGLILLVSLSCRQDKAKTPLKAKIVISTESGYKLQEVTYNTLTDPDSMNGNHAKIIGNAVLNLDSDKEVLTGSQPEDVYLKSGNDVFLEYTTKDDVLHPLNFDSMAMLTIYYHYEKTLEFWRDQLSLDLNDFGKRRLFYDPDIGAQSSLGSVTGTVKLNAAFLPGVKDFWFFKTSPIEKIPFKMNLGILAHEFSHGVFDYKFAKGNADFYISTRKESETQLSGMNEGVADYFSWMVTQREQEFVASLEDFAKERVLPVTWTTFDLIRNPSQCKGGFYCKGSVLASALYEVAKTKEVGAVVVGNTVYNALEDFRTDWEANKASEEFDYYFLLLRIIARATDEQKQHYCDSFIKWFDDSTNTNKVKEVCTSDA